MIIPFGKYKNYPIEHLPDEYLRWLYFQDFLKPDIEQAVKMEVYDRWPGKFELRLSSCLAKTSDGKQAELKRAVSAVYRELAMKFHPDHGGNVEAMKAINLFKEKLLAGDGL